MKSKPYRYPLYLLVRVLVFLIRLLPRRVAIAFASGLGSLSFHFLENERKKTLDHLRLAYGGEKTEKEIQSIGQRVFVNCAKSAVDWVLYPRYNQARWRKIIRWTDEMDRIDQVLARGKGLILVTAHFGNWEMLGATFSYFGYQGGTVARRIYYEPYNNWLVKTRLSKKLRTFYRDDSPKEIIRALKANQIMGVVADQDVDSIEGIFVSFFGHPAYTPVGPAKLSLATGAAIVPGFTIRLKDDTYQFVVEEPIFPDPDAPRQEEIERLTRLWNSVIEKYVRLYPDQWVWMHRRWKTQPSEVETKNMMVSPSGEERK